MRAHRTLSPEGSAPYVFVAPFLVAFLVFYLYPIANTIVMSFQNVVPGQTTWVGWKNYGNIINSDFWDALQVGLTYTVLTIAILVPVPILFAVLLNAGAKRLNAVHRAMFFMPSLVSVVVAGTIFRLMFAATDKSVVNAALKLIGISPVDWLMGGGGQAMFLMVMLATWRWLGVNLIYFLSGLQAIPDELYEAAQIDGANAFQRFWRITIPLLKPTILFVSTISIFGGFAMFEESYIFWQGNSPNNVGLTMVGLLYRRGFSQGDFGMASTYGLVLMAIVFVLSLIQLQLFGFFRKESNNG